MGSIVFPDPGLVTYSADVRVVGLVQLIVDIRTKQVTSLQSERTGNVYEF